MIDGRTPEEGAHLETRNGQQGEIVHVDEAVVRIDFDPELAGETMEFEFEIVESADVPSGRRRSRVSRPDGETARVPPGRPCPPLRSARQNASSEASR